MLKHKYNSLFFDLDDTLLDYSFDEHRAVKETLEEFGYECNEDVFELYETVQDWPSFEFGNINAETFLSSRFSRLLKALEVESDRKKMISVFFGKILKYHKTVAGAKALIKSLYEKGYKLYLTTNGFSQVQRARLKRSGFQKYFSGVFISEEIDLRKPSKAFFDYVFNRIPESNRRKVLIIGDAQTADILGGYNAGMDTCWYNPHGKQGKYKATYSVRTLKSIEKILE